MPMTVSEMKARYPGAVTRRFGDRAALSDAGEAATVVGRRDLVAETRDLRGVRFCKMTRATALVEGEDETRDSWRDGHEREDRRAGIFDPEMVLIWERSVVIEDLGRGDVS